MRIGNFNFQDDRTVTPYEERYIEDESCYLEVADMVLSEIKVHEFEYNVFNSTFGLISVTKNLLTNQGIILDDNSDYRFIITLSALTTLPLPTSIDLEINPNGTLWHPTTLSPSSLTYSEKYSSVAAAYNASIRIDTNSGTRHGVKVKVEILQIVPETRKYLICNGQYEEVSIPFVSFPIQKDLSSTFGGALTTQYYYVRKFRTSGTISIPNHRSFEKYNETTLICNITIAQNYFVDYGIKPINVYLMNGYPIGTEYMDEVNITDVATSTVTNFTPIPPAIGTPRVFADYNFSTVGFYTLSILYTSSVSTVTRVMLSVRYAYESSTSECPCLVCRDGNLLDVSWTNDCDETFNTSIEGSLQAGNYKIEGEGFQNSRGDEIYPVVSTQSEYILAIHRYSDAVFQGLTHLIASNKLVTINGADYRVKIDGITPKWNEWHTYGNIELTLVKVDSIKTYKRGCNC